MRATLDSYGLTKLSTASDVTDKNAYALSAVEKNVNIVDTLANLIAKKVSNTDNIFQIYNITGSPSEGSKRALDVVSNMKKDQIFFILTHQGWVKMYWGYSVGSGDTQYALIFGCQYSGVLDMNTCNKGVWGEWKSIVS